MKIARNVLDFALKHQINVRRDEHGDYTIFSRSPQRRAHFKGTTRGALAFMRRHKDMLSNGPDAVAEVD